MKLYQIFMLAVLVMFSAAVNAQSASEREMETAVETVSAKKGTDAKPTIVTSAPEGYVAKTDEEIKQELTEKAMEEGSLWGDAPAVKSCSGKSSEAKAACCSKKGAEAKAETKAACSGTAAKASGCCASKAKAAAKADEPN